MPGKFERMKGRERLFAALRGQEIDRLPAIAPTSVAVLGCMELSRSSFPRAHTDPGEMALLAATGHEILGFDSVMPYFSVHLESAALGCRVDWGDGRRMPRVLESALAAPDDLEVPGDLLQRREFSSLLEAIALLRKRFGDSVVVIGKVMGPWTLAYNLYGAPDLILDSMLEPERTKRFIEELAAVPIAFARAQFDAGADLVTWADHVTADLISAEIYAEFVLPVHKRASAVLGEGLVLHVCGNVMDRLDLIRETGFSFFHIDSRNDIAAALEIMKGGPALVGFVDNPETLARGGPADARREVRRIVEAGARFPAPECAVPYTVPIANLKALTEAVRSARMPTA